MSDMHNAMWGKLYGYMGIVWIAESIAWEICMRVYVCSSCPESDSCLLIVMLQGYAVLTISAYFYAKFIRVHNVNTDA